jgi:hypothetical protein
MRSWRRDLKGVKVRAYKHKYTDESLRPSPTDELDSWPYIQFTGSANRVQTLPKGMTINLKVPELFE